MNESVLVLVVGVALLGLYFWLYRGGSRTARWWSRPRGLLDADYLEHLMLAVLPALGVTTTIGGFLRLVEPGGAVEGALSLFAVVAMLWGLWGLLLFIPIPRWMMPRWYREMKPPKQKRDKEQKQSPINLWGQE